MRLAGTEQAIADELNRRCFCLDIADGEQPFPSLAGAGLVSPLAVFVTHAQVAAMQAIIRAVEAAVLLPGYLARALADAPAIARESVGAPAVLHGFDFHLSADGPRLIEINTNAGGALVVADHLRRVRMPCGDLGASFGAAGGVDALEAGLWSMFVDVWRRTRGRGDGELRHVVIVDRAPQTQFLYGEFLRFQRLFEAHGVDARIADPEELRHAVGALWLNERRVDLVYNRLTDFYFDAPESLALRQAYQAGSVVVTPDPRAHAIYASKRNLVWLSDPALLGEWGLARSHAEVLRDGVPRTELVDPAQAESLWTRRRGLFFKPVAGFGSRGAYRGDKLTRGAFQRILQGDYVAQALVPPPLRGAAGEDAGNQLKFDVRNYVYDGRVLVRGARLYQGQTTNFRSPGGGFAPLVHPPASGIGCAAS
jgi:hypothetical protein